MPAGIESFSFGRHRKYGPSPMCSVLVSVRVMPPFRHSFRAALGPTTNPHATRHAVSEKRNGLTSSILPSAGNDTSFEPSAGTPQPPPPAYPSSPAQRKSPVSRAPKHILSLRRVLDKQAPTLKIPTPGGVDLIKQTDYFLAAVPSLVAFVVFNQLIKVFMLHCLNIRKFPPPLVGMFIFFGTLLFLREEAATAMVDFFHPAVTLLTNFLPVFFMPGLLNAPAALSGIAVVDILKFCLVVALGMISITLKAGFLCEYIIKISRAATPDRAPASSIKSEPWFSAHLELIMGCLTALTGLMSLVCAHIFSVPPQARSKHTHAHTQARLNPSIHSPSVPLPCPHIPTLHTFPNFRVHDFVCNAGTTYTAPAFGQMRPSQQQNFYAFATFFAFIFSSRLTRIISPAVTKVSTQQPSEIFHLSLFLKLDVLACASSY